MKLRILELNKHNFYGNMVMKPKGDAGIDLYFPKFLLYETYEKNTFCGAISTFTLLS